MPRQCCPGRWRERVVTYDYYHVHILPVRVTLSRKELIFFL